MRKLAYEMNRRALSQEARQLGKRLPNAQVPAHERLTELRLPVLVIVGANDTPYMHASADYMMDKLPSARKAAIEDAGHLPNMDQPAAFESIVEAFLREIHAE